MDRHFCNFFPPCDRDLRSIDSPTPPQLPIIEAGRPVGQPRPLIGLPVPGTLPATEPLPMPLLDAIELVAVSTAPVLLEHRSWTDAVRSGGRPGPLLPLTLLGPPLPTPLPPPPPPAPAVATELDASPFICSMVSSSGGRATKVGNLWIRLRCNDLSVNTSQQGATTEERSFM